jgi:hypothetical protein
VNECKPLATGKYPYELDGGIAGLAMQVVMEEPPRVTPDMGCSAGAYTRPLLSST